MRINKISSPDIITVKKPKPTKRFKDGVLLDKDGSKYTGKVIHKTSYPNLYYLMNFDEGILAQSIEVKNETLSKAKKYFYNDNGKLEKIVIYNRHKRPFKLIEFFDNRITKRHYHANKPGEIAAEIRFNDDTIPFGADASFAKYDTKNKEIRYYKNGKFIVDEKIIDDTKRDMHGEKRTYLESVIFDRRTGDKYNCRRHYSGSIDILRKGSWTGNRNFEVEHQNSKGETTGYSKREYIKVVPTPSYYAFGKYCRGDHHLYYIQTRYDKNFNPVGSFRGMETVYGKLL